MLPRLILAAVALSLAGATPAAADSIAFIQGNDIWLATPDGARRQQVTHTGTYYYVSQADDGTLAALVPGEKIQKLSRTGQILAEFTTYVSDGSPSRRTGCPTSCCCVPRPGRTSTTTRSSRRSAR